MEGKCKNNQIVNKTGMYILFKLSYTQKKERKKAKHCNYQRIRCDYLAIGSLPVSAVPLLPPSGKM